MAKQPRFAGVEYPIRPMAAVPADALPDDQPGIWALETKLDGWRCLAMYDRGRVVLQSRQQRPLSRYFPEVVAAVRELGVDAVFDGELVAWTDGHLDFAALQQRIHPSAARARRMALALPACLVVFDLIARKGTDFRDRPYAKRRRKLEKLLDRPLPAHLALMPITTSTAVARLWMADHAAVGVEGVVAKRLDCPYRSGRRCGWQKIRTRTTAEAVVGGVLGPRERPDVLIVGCRDAQGRLRICGRTTTLSAAAKTSLADILEPAGAAHPWPATIPASRLGALPGSTIAYTRVKPRVVVELEVDTALENMRWRHPCRYRRVRRDLKPADLRAGPSPRD